jgi:hypothetical protein
MLLPLRVKEMRMDLAQLYPIFHVTYTISGVPVLWPLSRHDIRLLPAPLARRGEAIVGTLALAMGYLLIRGDF